MPVLDASELEVEPFLRMLLMGEPKNGKTTHAVSTAPSPVRVLICESDSALRGAKRESRAFNFERVRADANGRIWDTMMSGILNAKRDAAAGKIKTCVVDPLNHFAFKLLTECENATKTKEGNVDGRKAHPEFTKRIIHAVDLMMTIPCHLIVVNHHMDTGGDDDPDKPKSGFGIVPLMPNLATRKWLASIFYDIVWQDIAWAARDANGKPTGKLIDNHNERVFVTGPRGAWGYGCRSLKRNKVVPAHVGQLIERMAEEAKTEESPVEEPPKKPIPLRPLSTAAKK